MFWKASLTEHCARTICLMESYDIKTGCLILIKMIEARGERKTMRTLIFDDTLLDKYDKRPVEWPSRALYRYLYIGRSFVDQCIHILLNKYVLHQVVLIFFRITVC